MVSGWGRHAGIDLIRGRKEGGKLDHYLQVKPVEDALRYTEQKQEQNNSRIDRYCSIDIMKRSNLTKGDIAIGAPTHAKVMTVQAIFIM